MLSPERWASLAAGRGGAPTVGELPLVVLALMAIAAFGGAAMRAIGLSRVESLLFAAVGPLLVLVDVPFGSGGPGVRILANATGCLVPIAVALCIVATRRSGILPVAILVVVGIATTYFLSRVVPARGVLLNYQDSALIIGILGGVLFRTAPRAAGAWAFAAGAVGTLIGADLLHLSELLAMKDAAAITLGGAGLLDGILLTAFVASIVALVTAHTIGFLTRLHARSNVHARA